MCHAQVRVQYNYMNVSNRGVLQYVLLKTVLQNKMAVRVNLNHWISHDK
jgi:hypothetical protein